MPRTVSLQAAPDQPWQQITEALTGAPDATITALYLTTVTQPPNTQYIIAAGTSDGRVVLATAPAQIGWPGRCSSI